MQIPFIPFHVWLIIVPLLFQFKKDACQLPERRHSDGRMPRTSCPQMGDGTSPFRCRLEARAPYCPKSDRLVLPIDLHIPKHESIPADLHRRSCLGYDPANGD